MKKINITTIALLVYLIVMSIIGWPGNNPETIIPNISWWSALRSSSSSFYAICKSSAWECGTSGIKTTILPSNKNTACFSSQKNRLNELYFITLVLILLLFRLHRLLECLVKTTHSINYSIINKYNLNRTHTPLVSLTFLKWVTFIILTFYSLVLKRH